MRDLNTKYFHLSTIIRQRWNSIDSIKTAAGRWLIDQQEIGEYFATHFFDTFSSRRPEITLLVEDLILPWVTEEDKCWLMAIPLEDAIEEAVFQIGAHKAPGPDEIIGLFF